MKLKHTTEDLLAIVFFLAMLIFLVRSCAADETRSFGRECLALVGYSEARSDGLSGMIEVEIVVLNRLRSKRWGESICDVALAPGQFQGIDDWTPPRIAHEHEAWEQAMDAAEIVLGGFNGPKECAGVLYFSTEPTRGSICQVGHHFFGVKP